MKSYWLSIRVTNNEGNPLYQERISLQRHHLIGRSRQKCQDISLCFDTPVDIIVLPQANRLSGFHCCLYQDKAGYWLIDGWGDHRSTNGIKINGRQSEFAVLRSGDTIFLGSKEVCLQYEVETNREVTEFEKATIS